jgi:hypothetical protein
LQFLIAPFNLGEHLVERANQLTEIVIGLLDRAYAIVLPLRNDPRRVGEVRDGLRDPLCNRAESRKARTDDITRIAATTPANWRKRAVVSCRSDSI